jgi:CHAT domain-containing protein
LGLSSTFLSIPAWSNARGPELKIQTSSPNALELVQEAQQRYNAGQFQEAVQLWQEAVEAYQQVKDEEGMAKSLINQSQALQDLGLYPKACRTLLQALTVANPDCSQEQLDQLLETISQQRDSLSLTQAIGLRSLGDVLRRQGLLPQSQAILRLSWSVAEGSPEASATLLSLGNTERALGNQIRDRWDYEEVTEIIDGESLAAALDPYQPAFSAYSQSATPDSEARPLTKIQAQLNHFKLLIEIQKWWEEQAHRRIASWSRLNEPLLVGRARDFLSQLELKLSQDARALQGQIDANLDNLPPSRAAIYARLNFAQSLIQLQRTDKVEPLLEAALQEARTLKDKRAETYALGYLGQLDYQEGRLVRATELTRQALMLAQEQNINGDARESAYLWQSQLGSLLRKQGEPQGAIAAYTAAFNTLQSLRSDLNANNQDVQFDFLQEVKPVYLELADLLLSSSLSDSELNSLVLSNPSFTPEKSGLESSKNPLELARRVIESLQLAELDNFFQDPCSEEADIAVQIDDIDARAAVIYPIVLPDRLEVILSLSGKNLRQVAIPITEQEVNDTLDRLYDSLDNLTANNSTRNILSTSNPDPEELKQNLQVLLPIFSEIYNWFIQPFKAELDANSIRNLVFVLNGRLQKVPMAALYDGQQYLIEQYGVSLAPSLQLIDTRQLKGKPIRVLAAGVSQQVKVQGEIFPALANVPRELEQIEAAFPESQKLLDGEFTEAAIQSRLQSNFPIVHLATHGLFSSNPQKNFILAGDGRRISINELSTLLRSAGSGELELLVLSACETATGDERAVLGLAGMAVRSGARSTLATLWPVGDASTAELMGQFYQALKKTEGKKLDALRSAQLSLIESLKGNPPFQELQHLPPHPYYWAPYVLVGNWQ